MTVMPEVVGELPEVFGVAANADLDGALRVEHAVEHGLTEGPAVVELAAFERTARVAMRVDVDHADRSILADGAQERKAHRMIAADRQRNDV